MYRIAMMYFARMRGIFHSNILSSTIHSYRVCIVYARYIAMTRVNLFQLRRPRFEPGPSSFDNVHNDDLRPYCVTEVEPLQHISNINYSVGSIIYRVVANTNSFSRIVRYGNWINYGSYMYRFLYTVRVGLLIRNAYDLSMIW